MVSEETSVVDPAADSEKDLLETPRMERKFRRTKMLMMGSRSPSAEDLLKGKVRAGVSVGEVAVVPMELEKVAGDLLEVEEMLEEPVRQCPQFSCHPLISCSR